MEYISEEISTRVSKECDVLVAGGGIAGIAAALAAARQGANVILLEKQFMLGGLATAGLVTIYLPLCDGKGHQVSFGIAEELLRLSIKYGYEAKYPEAWLNNGSFEEKAKTRFEVRFNAQLFAIAAEQLLINAGVKILYGTSVCAMSAEDGRINHVIVESKSGREAIKVNSVVDTTGDADICNMSGEKTALFAQGNVLAAWYYHTDGKNYDLNMLGFSDIPDDEKDSSNEVKLLIEERFQGIEAEELTKMTILSHDEIIRNVIKHQKENPNHMPVTIATTPQIRMTRRIDGVCTLKEEQKAFDDSIGVIGNWKKRGPVYEIPFSALHGSRIKNLVTAGRCISATDAMWDVTRVIPACAVTGEAAGTAAAMTNDFLNIDVSKLQKILADNGVKLKNDITL